MSETNARVLALFSAAVPALVDIVASGRARSAQIRFTDPNGPQYSNFWWISVDKLAQDNGSEPKLFACTNDIDLMVGIPPSFHKSVALDSGSELVEAAIAFLTEKLGKAARVEILLRADGFKNFVGNSDDGFENLAEQVVADIC